MKVRYAIPTLAAALMLSISATTARAVPVAATDFNSLLGSLGSQVAAADTVFFGLSPDFANLGNVRGQAWLNSSTNTYTYVYQVIANTNNIASFSTGFAVNNFNGVAGYSFADAIIAGANNGATAFSIDRNASNQLVFTPSSNFFGRRDVVTFFFQTQTAPNPNPGSGVVITDPPNTGTADTVIPGDIPAVPTPVPEPASLGLLALGGLALLRRRTR